ncbi:MFS transporter [Nonomuraea sediminis]|uniref:MFS transporter n=1 Tax=Nonomuraea sediminis TaxID=2835864 RepID=UPI001BDC0070|nr:MFS transporter [Nonomuraea sediminis]
MATISDAHPSRLWNRQLQSYPDTGPRLWYLTVAVLATVVLYYELYVGGGVAPLILEHYKMSFTFYVNMLVVANLFGAFASLAAGLADRWGRANLVTYGLLITGVMMFVLPAAPNSVVFAILSVVVGIVEGVILVATPALVRDFSPQLGRASAMGFWTLGPVVGSLVVSWVATATLPRLLTWESQFYIVGVVGLIMFVVALFGLRELAPGLRDQIMVSVRDRKIIEARAKQLDVDLSHPWRQMMRRDIILPALGISIFLLIYYTAVGFFTIYLTTIFAFTTSQANGLNAWYWAVDAVALVIAGILSDRLRVRKPFMVVGTVIAVAMTIVFLTRATHPDTGYGTLALIISVLAAGLAIAYAPWMAAFTETVERRNPALTATGLAVWGWIIRIVVTASLFFVPYVVSSMNTLVEAPAYLAAAKQAGANPPPALVEKLAEIKAAAAIAPGQWQTWFWICVVAQLVFIPLMLPLAGRWSPKAARAEIEAHDREVERLLDGS